MQRARDFFARPFGSALLGGLVVAAAGLGAIEAGWIGDDESSSPIVAAPLARLAASNDKGLTVGEIYERTSGGIAFIQADQATGSGFVIDDQGHVLTNAHVVEGANRIELQVGDDGDTLGAELVGSDPSSDVALLEVEDSAGLRALEMGDSAKVAVGDPVV